MAKTLYTVVVKKDTHKKLSQLKIDLDITSFDELILLLTNKYLLGVQHENRQDS